MDNIVASINVDKQPFINSQERILVLAPLTGDTVLADRVLSKAGFTTTNCHDFDDLCMKLQEGAGAAIIAEEALPKIHLDKLLETLDQQPPWSALPLIILTQKHKPTATTLRTLVPVNALRNASFLERPVRVMTLISTVQAALAARRQQYEVQHLLEQLEESVDRRDEFLAMLGHELRNPLAAMSNAIGVLKRLSVDHHPLFLTTRNILERQMQHLGCLLNDLLDVSRVTRGKITIRLEKVELATVVSSALHGIRPLIEQYQHKLKVQLPPQPLYLKGDPTRLAQLLSNLLSNAAKYTEPGGFIDLSAAQIADQIEIRVRDTGVGMTADLIARIFDLFAQAERPLDRSQGGLGVGLTVTKRLVELHGGTIEAISPGPGCGSKFVVRLPTNIEQPEFISDHESSSIFEPKKALRILVVDDNQDAVRALAMLLEMLDYQVYSAYDGVEALELAHRHHPDVMLLDLGLPHIDGYELARRFRADPAFAEARLVAITGYGGEDNRQRALAAGFDCHLTKPVDLAILQEVLTPVI
jgi:signal transduction histidine kinase